MTAFLNYMNGGTEHKKTIRNTIENDVLHNIIDQMTKPIENDVHVLLNIIG